MFEMEDWIVTIDNQPVMLVTDLSEEVQIDLNTSRSQPCESQSKDNYYCTRTKNHSGKHIADMGKYVCQIWGDDD
jgi:hypothetical protein